MKRTSHETEINGVNIHYRLYGHGEPLVLIMGLGGNADWWDEDFLKPLAERFQVITFDNRGAGRSGRSAVPLSIVQMASDTIGLMDHLGLASAHILGFSMGGMIAQETACTYPERVRRLMLICTYCGGEERVPASPEVQRALYLPRDNISAEDMARGMCLLLFPNDFIKNNPRKISDMVEDLIIAPIESDSYFGQLEAANSWSIYPRLRDLRHPTLIITGGHDVVIPPQNSRILAEAIPNSRLVEIPEAGHQVTSMFPERVAQLVLDFLA
jgi:3-oxoadipate enol-lactonase